MSDQFLGLGKTKFNSSVCLIDDITGSVELLLTERMIRKKNSGLWPEASLKLLFPKLRKDKLLIAENRDVHRPRVIEDTQNKLFPFYDYLKKQKLDFFTSQANAEIEFVSHHLCHAYAALALSPFEKSIMIVMDGAGSEVNPGEYEECTVYLQDDAKLTPVFNETVSFHNDLGNRIGANYEKAAEFIFNSPNASGKVMGLASFGKRLKFEGHVAFQQSLPMDKAFRSKNKQDWEALDHTLFKDVAATVQGELEEDYEKIIRFIKDKYPQYENLILTGGCALNCTNNAKILYSKKFKKIFIPPFPGDECIGFGLAFYLKLQKNSKFWKPLLFENQSVYLGAESSMPEKKSIEKEFSDKKFDMQEHENIIDVAADLLKDGHIIAWFQGRSESGPRALGNRSILARPDVPGLKNRLNESIKFRESFRPYGCSVLHDRAHEYFNIEEGFDNPYMSYAIEVLPAFKEKLQEVSHIDGTSRMQTVRIGQNEKFYKLIECFGRLTGLYCLLNTSLNVMDEPILETVHDAKRFMENSPIEYLVIDNFLIKKNS